MGPDKTWLLRSSTEAEAELVARQPPFSLLVDAPHRRARLAALLAQLEHAEPLPHAAPLDYPEALRLELFVGPDGAPVQALPAHGAAPPALRRRLHRRLLNRLRAEETLPSGRALARAPAVLDLGLRVAAAAVHLCFLLGSLGLLLAAAQEAEPRAPMP